MATDGSDVVVEPTVQQVAAEPKKTKEPKAKKPKAAAKKPKTAASHPTYAEMITDAIVTLKERNGSSQIAIAKFVEEKEKNLPANFRKLLLGNLRKLVASGKLTKVKGSFKIAAAAAPKASTEKKPKVVKPKAVIKATKPKKSPAKAKAAKPKAAVAAKPKPATKAKTAAKVKPAVKAKVKVSEKPAKAARTSSRTTPGKKAAAPKAVVKKVAAPKKTKVVKTPVKKAAKK